MMPNYKVLSTIYDMLDVLCFNHKSTSPRTAMLNAIPDARLSVLDVCAGTCSDSILIAENRPKAKITALDLSDDMLKIAEKKFRKKGVQNIKITVADACNTGLPSDSFDVILLSLVLHEISEDLRTAMLMEAKRLLSPSGQIIVIEWEQPTRLFQRIMFAPIKQLEPRGFKEFLQLDLTVYFQELGFSGLDSVQCDYTKMYRIR